MTIKECYVKLGGNYNEILKRLRRDKTICRLAVKFLSDDSYAKIESALKENDYETAFQGAHTLKGICQNLAFTKLYDTAAEITETIRARDTKRTEELMPVLAQNYALTTEALREFEAAQGD